MSHHKAGEIPQERITLMEEHITKLVFLMKKIDRDIGYNFWKKYVASAFWSQISTPINLIITFLTAITAAQAQSSDLLPQGIYSQLAIGSLIITTLNTFFRPHTQFTTNSESLQKWNDVGVRFEKEYYDKIIVRLYTDEEFQNVKNKITNYEKIQDDMNSIRKSDGSNTVNFITDLLFILCYSTCIRKYKRWLDHDKKIAKDTEHITTERRNKEVQHLTDRRKNQVDTVLEEERLRSYARVGVAEIELEEKEKMRAIANRSSICGTTISKDDANRRVFELFDSFVSSPSVSPPASPPPPPPPSAPPQELPPTLSISDVIEVKS